MTTATKPLVAYHGSEKLKTRIMAQVQAHREADEITHGAYYEYTGKLKVCAVGCVLHDRYGGHPQYESEFGVPVQLAYLEDGLFESMPLGDAKEWPARFMGAIRVGADLSKVWPAFAVWLMVDEKWGLVNVTNVEGVKAICRRVAEGYQRTIDDDPLSDKDAQALARDAWAAWDAWDAGDAWDARAARAARAARDAGDAWDAWDARAARAARAAWDAWDARAAWAAWAAGAAWAARAARAACVKASADKLIELIEAA
jgi:hypothetical protein